MRGRNIEGTAPKQIVIGRHYHISGWKTGAHYVLSSLICDDTLAVLYTPKTRKRICVPIDKLRNTYRNRGE